MILNFYLILMLFPEFTKILEIKAIILNNLLYHLMMEYHLDSFRELSNNILMLPHTIHPFLKNQLLIIYITYLNYTNR